jgi:release factor glutamine methyltransferase
MLACKDLEQSRGASIIELGTGSGNIAIALAKFVKNASVVSIDNSQKAVDLARENAVSQNVASLIEFSVMDMFEPVDQLLLRRFDLLVSNPPYISADDWETLPTEVKRYEPKGALTDFKDGYESHQRIIELAPYLLKNDGIVLVEVGFGQSKPVCEMMRKAGFRDVVSLPDLQGVQRVVRASCPSKVRGLVNVN